MEDLIEKKDGELLQKHACDSSDYLIAVACGAVSGLVDIFLVGAPSQSVIGKWTDAQVDEAVKKFAEKSGWSPRPGKEGNVASAIGYLERQYKVNYDQRYSADVGGAFNMSTKNHHIKSLSHSPDIIGLFFSVLNQFTSTSSFVSGGKLVTIKTESYELQGTRLGLDDTHDELDWLVKNSDCLVLLYDRKQIACPSDIPYDVFHQRLDISHCGIRPVELQDQMRIRAGNDYVPYIHAVLNQKQLSALNFKNYEFKIFCSFSDMIETLDMKEKSVGLCRLCGGYAWKWIAKDSPDRPDISIDGVDVWWNRQTGGWLRNPNAKQEMGSIYSLPGLDLNYAAVVIGPDLYYDTESREVRVNRKHFFDNKVKRSVADDELKNYILNTYAVLLTRGILGTYVYT